MNNRNIIIGGAVLVVLILGAIGAFFILGGNQEVTMGEPVDIVHEFSKSWLDARLSSTTDPYAEGLAETPYLSKSLRKNLKEAKGQEGIDPVVCQTNLPQNIAERVVSATDKKAEILVTARKTGSTEQAIVTLIAKDGGWYIDAIKCSPGEFPPDREFSFEHDGFLLKNVPSALDSKYWYIVFEENGEKGHFAPLFFDAKSTCKPIGGEAEACNPDSFKETAKVHVQAQLSETGAQVVHLEFIKE